MTPSKSIKIPIKIQVSGEVSSSKEKNTNIPQKEDISKIPTSKLGLSFLYPSIDSNYSKLMISLSTT